MPNLKCNSLRELTVHGVNRHTNYNYLHQTQSSWRWRQLAPPNSRNKTYHETWDSHCDVAEDLNLLECYTVSLGVTPRHITTALKTWKQKIFATWFWWFCGWLIVPPDNILGEKVVLCLPAMYSLHIQEAIKYCMLTFLWTGYDVTSDRHGGALCVGHWIFWCCQGWSFTRASRASLQKATFASSHVFIHQARRTVATLLTAWKNAASAFC
jgi:hypothetical protein